MKISKTYEFEGLEAKVLAELERRGWSIKDLAEKSGVGTAYISQWLDGKTIGLESKWKKIEEALGVDFGLNL